MPAALRIPADGIQVVPRCVALGLFLRVLMSPGNVKLVELKVRDADFALGKLAKAPVNQER